MEDDEHNYIVKKIILKVEKRALKLAEEKSNEEKAKRIVDDTLDIENVNWNSEVKSSLVKEYESPIQNFGDISAINQEERRMSDMTKMIDLNDILENIDDAGDKKTEIKMKKFREEGNMKKKVKPCNVNDIGTENKRLMKEKEPVWKNKLRTSKNYKSREKKNNNRRSLQKLEKIGTIFNNNEKRKTNEIDDQYYHEKFKIEKKVTTNKHKRSRTAIEGRKEYSKTRKSHEKLTREFLKRHNSSRLMRQEMRQNSTNRLRKSDKAFCPRIQNEETEKKGTEQNKYYDKKSHRGSSLTILNKYPFGSEKIDTSGLTKVGASFKKDDKNFLLVSNKENYSLRKNLKSSKEK